MSIMSTIITIIYKEKPCILNKLYLFFFHNIDNRDNNVK